MKDNTYRPQVEQAKPQGFDLTVHHRDPQTGLITHIDPYTLHVIGGEGFSRVHAFERPKMSGNCWSKDGRAIGRWIRDENGKGHYDANAEHVPFEAPLTGDQILAQELIAKNSRIAALEKEIAATKAEAQKKQADTPKKQGS